MRQVLTLISHREWDKRRPIRLSRHCLFVMISHIFCCFQIYNTSNLSASNLCKGCMKISPPYLIFLDGSCPAAAFVDTNCFEGFDFSLSSVVRKSLWEVYRRRVIEKSNRSSQNSKVVFCSTFIHIAFTFSV